MLLLCDPISYYHHIYAFVSQAFFFPSVLQTNARISQFSMFVTCTNEGVSKSFRTGRLERELQMVHLSATRCSCIAILWVSLMSFASITLCVASQRVFVVVVVYFVMDSVRKLLDTPSYHLMFLALMCSDVRTRATCCCWLHKDSKIPTRNGFEKRTMDGRALPFLNSLWGGPRVVRVEWTWWSIKLLGHACGLGISCGSMTNKRKGTLTDT
jgi:hypothetical protein